MTIRPWIVACLSIVCCSGSAADDLPPIPPIQRVLPPEGVEIPADIRQRLEMRLATTKKRLEEVEDKEMVPDVEIFTKAVELALLHREFYVEKDLSKADWALDEANKRLDSLEKGESPWMRATGLVVRGYRSEIDESAQPYGLVIPQDHDFNKQSPLYVWLHGRGDKNTDLHFLYERATKVGQIEPAGAMVLHPFGRQCVGYKHAGETDVEEAFFDVRSRYRIDADRVVLIGFSMGGAGAWHIGAHRTSRFVAISPGAGFAETARYQKLSSDNYPPWYEQKLWGQYDVPNYVRNLFNTQVIAYSGELDKQIQAARVMEEAYQAEGRQLTHLLGPGVEHKYESKTLEDLLARLVLAVNQGREKVPRELHLQTQTLDYATQRWITVCALAEHWQDSRVDAQIIGKDHVRVTTKNVTALCVSPFADMGGTKLEIDGDVVVLGETPGLAPGNLKREIGRWREGRINATDMLPKNPIWHGPIDDAFKQPFVVVTPTGKSRNNRFQAWVDFELDHFRRRWRALMRADLPEMRDVDVLHQDIRQLFRSLILFGDAESNAVLRHLQVEGLGGLQRFRLPLASHDGQWEFGGRQYDGDQYVPVCIFPLVHNIQYVVLNSGLTFREGHDRTNSLQNPKLPDWAIIDITQPPDAFAPGRIHDADFFDEKWQLKRQPKGP